MLVLVHLLPSLLHLCTVSALLDHGWLHSGVANTVYGLLLLVEGDGIWAPRNFGRHRSRMAFTLYSLLLLMKGNGDGGGNDGLVHGAAAEELGWEEGWLWIGGNSAGWRSRGRRMEAERSWAASATMSVWLATCRQMSWRGGGFKGWRRRGTSQSSSTTAFVTTHSMACSQHVDTRSMRISARTSLRVIRRLSRFSDRLRTGISCRDWVEDEIAYQALSKVDFWA